jgi:hypothetical protein
MDQRTPLLATVAHEGVTFMTDCAAAVRPVSRESAWKLTVGLGVNSVLWLAAWIATGRPIFAYPFLMNLFPAVRWALRA